MFRQTITPLIEFLPSALLRRPKTAFRISLSRGKSQNTIGSNNTEHTAEKDSSETLNNKISEIVSDDRSLFKQASPIASLDAFESSSEQCTRMTSANKEQETVLITDPLPQVPTNCCMSGCPNCVWLQFAEEMLKYGMDGSERARKFIEEIDDQNLRVFLLMELERLKNS